MRIIATAIRGGIRLAASAQRVRLTESARPSVSPASNRSRRSRKHQVWRQLREVFDQRFAPKPHSAEFIQTAQQQKITRIASSRNERALRRQLNTFVRSLAQGGTPTEGIDPCHSLIGNLNQFSAPEILQMSCLGQRSGRFTFKSGRGNSEIYLAHGSVRHAVFGSLEGEEAVAEIFRWRQGRFYFEEGIISQVQSVDRPWAHLLIDNLRKLDETMELSATSQS